MFSRINRHPTDDGGGDRLPSRPVADGPLLREVFELPDGPGVVQRTFGTLALAIIQAGGTLTLQSSESGPSYVEVELRGHKIKLSPQIGGDLEEATLIQMPGKELTSQSDIAANTAQHAIDVLKFIMHSESQRRK